MTSSFGDEIEFQSPFASTSSLNENTNTIPIDTANNNVNNQNDNPTNLTTTQSRIQAGLPPLNFRSYRRGSVSAESYNPNNYSNNNNNNNNNHSKNNSNTSLKKSTGSVSLNAENAVKNNFLFKSLDPEQLALIFDAMIERDVTPGEVIIRQGEEGDNFYIVEAGRYGVEVDGREVVQIGPGGSFGELALMYNAPRAATVKSLEMGKMYAVDRITFRRVIIDLAHDKRCKYMAFLRTVPLFATLSDLEVGRIADALEPVDFDSQQLVLKQGDPGDSFYIIIDGSAQVIKDDSIVGTLSPGSYFGELALLKRQPRAATIKAITALKCVSLSEADFVRLLGPLEDILKRNEEQYNQYKQYYNPQ